MKSILLTALVVAVAGTAAYAQQGRMSDKSVKALIEQMDHSRDRFEDALDGQLKRSIIKGPAGEVNISDFLDDIQENVARLGERYNGDYSAGAEVLTVLRQGTSIDAYVKRQPPQFDGRAEWDKLAGDMGTLAAAYGTTFPLAEGATARRMGDKEVAQAADALARGADQFRKAASSSLKTAGADKPTMTAVETESKQLESVAKALKSNVSGSKPASAEARAVLDQAKKLQSMIEQTPGLAAAGSAWSGVMSNVTKIEQAFATPGA